MKGRSDAHGNQHHACDGSSSEHKQVSDRPAGTANGREHEQCCRSRAGEPMHNSNHQWAYRLVELESLQTAIEPGQRSLFIGVLMCLRMMTVLVTVNVVTMAVGVRMQHLRSRSSFPLRRQASNETDDVHYAQQKEHQSNR